MKYGVATLMAALTTDSDRQDASHEKDHYNDAMFCLLSSGVDSVLFHINRDQR